MYLLRHTRRKTKHLTSLTRKKNGMNVSHTRNTTETLQNLSIFAYFWNLNVPEEYHLYVEKRHIFTEFYFKCTENQEYKKKLVDILKSHETPRMKDRICINYHVYVFRVRLFEKRKKILSKSRQRMTWVEYGRGATQYTHL